MLNENTPYDLSPGARIRLRDLTANHVFSFTGKLSRHGKKDIKMGYTTALKNIYDQELRLATDHLWLQAGLYRVPLNTIIGFQARISTYVHSDVTKDNLGEMDYGLGEAKNIMVGLDRPVIDLKPEIQRALANHYVLIARNNQAQIQFVFYNLQTNHFENTPTYGWQDYSQALTYKDDYLREHPQQSLFVGKILWHDGVCQLGIRTKAYYALKNSIYNTRNIRY